MFAAQLRFVLIFVGLSQLMACNAILPSSFGDPEPQNNQLSIKHSLASDKRLMYRPESSEFEHSYQPQLPVKPREMHKSVGDYAEQLTMALMDRAFNLSSSDRILVGSFVRFNQSLREPTVLGNRLSEAMIAELQHYGLMVVEAKLAADYAITTHGDLALSRNVRELKRQLKVDYILTGTLIERAEGVEVNARIVSVSDNTVAAAARLEIPFFIVANENYFGD